MTNLHTDHNDKMQTSNMYLSIPVSCCGIAEIKSNNTHVHLFRTIRLMKPKASLTMSFSGNVRPPAVDADDAMEATDVPDVRRGITPDVRRTGCAVLGDCGIGEDISAYLICVCVSSGCNE